jgi:hypothetical protein
MSAWISTLRNLSGKCKVTNGSFFAFVLTKSYKGTNGSMDLSCKGTNGSIDLSCKGTNGSIDLSCKGTNGSIETLMKFRPKKCKGTNGSTETPVAKELMVFY